MLVLLFAFLLGAVVGLRTFTAPAVLLLMRRPGIAAYVVAAAALIEYAGDLAPKAPSRTGLLGMSARVISGAFVGWTIAGMGGGSTILGCVAGVAGAFAGAHGGLKLRLKLIDAIGAVPSGLLEDAIAIGLSVLLVSRLP